MPLPELKMCLRTRSAGETITSGEHELCQGLRVELVVNAGEGTRRRGWRRNTRAHGLPGETMARA